VHVVQLQPWRRLVDVFTCSMFLVSLAVKIPGNRSARWVRLTSKKAAIEWAESLPDDEAPNAKGQAREASPAPTGCASNDGSEKGLSDGR
jgi:hypothetical protein